MLTLESEISREKNMKKKRTLQGSYLIRAGTFEEFSFFQGGICDRFVKGSHAISKMMTLFHTKVSRHALLQYLLGMRGSFSHDALSDVLVSELQFQQILYLAHMVHKVGWGWWKWPQSHL